MKSKAIIPLVLGLAVGIATVKLALNTIRKAQAGRATVTMVNTVRAKVDIDPYKTITAEMVEVIETPENPLVPDRERIESLEDVLGRVSGKSIPQFSAVLQSMIAPEGTSPGMVGRIPNGFRAVSVRIDEVTGVAFQISPGDWVDVIVVMDVSNLRGGGRDTIAEVILQHIQVAAIGYSTSPSSRPSAGKVKPAKSVTLLVADGDVPKLHLAATRGKITLAMRGHEDTLNEKPASANLSDVVSALRGTSPEPQVLAVGTTSRPRWVDPPEETPHEIVVHHGVIGARDPNSIERITFENGHSTKILSVSNGYPSRGAASTSRAKPAARNRLRGDAHARDEYRDQE